jgi:hypothetical protein
VKKVYPEANRRWSREENTKLTRIVSQRIENVQDSKKSVSSANSVHVLSLWRYDLLIFTRDQNEPKESISNTEVKNEKAIVLQ